MTAQATVVRITYKKNGPILAYEKLEVLGNAEVQAGARAIEEDFATVCVCVSVARTPVEEDQAELNTEAQKIYRRENPRKNVVFQ